MSYFFLSLSVSLLSRHHVRVRAQTAAAANVTQVLNVQYVEIPLIVANKYGKKVQQQDRFINVLFESYKTPAIFNPYRHQDHIHMHAVTQLLATLRSESYLG